MRAHLKKEQEEIEALAHMLAAEEDDEPFDPGERKKKPVSTKPWMPRLNEPTQAIMFNDPADLVVGYGPKYTGKCARLSTTVVYTASGIKRLRAMRPESEPCSDGFSPINQAVVSFDGNRLVEANATFFYTEKERQAITLDLANGAELTGSPRHPVWCCYPDTNGRGVFGYLSTSEIKRRIDHGERIWTPMMRHPNYISDGRYITVSGVTINEEIGYMLGALVGDGGLNKAESNRRTVAFTNADMECISRVGKAALYMDAVLTRTGSNPYQYRFANADRLKKLIVALDINHLSYFKRIPDAIVESPKSVMSAFFSGLFDTDGTVCKNTGSVQLCTTSELLSLDVQIMMAAFGINAVRRPKKTASGKPTWNIYITGEWAEMFADQIGFKITRKQALIPRRSPSRMSPHGTKRHHYGYPKYICDELRRISRACNPGIRTTRGRLKLKFVNGSWKRRLGNPPWAPELLSVRASTSAEASAIEESLNVRRDAYYKKHLRDREWHDSVKHLHSFGSVPTKGKLEQFFKVYGGAEELKNYTITDTWIEIKAARNSEHDLADLSVDDTHSFVAGGFINHNTVGLGHKIFRHCWQEFDALFSIIGVSAESLGQGICHDLQSLVGPTWRDGNREPMYLRQGGILVPNPKAGELIDDGLGIQYSKWKIDPVSKRMWMWVQNRHGGKSCIRVASIPHPSMIEDRITGPAPSGIMLEEATKCRGEEYFRFPSLQLYRRRDIVGPQQFLMACNPEGPDHWVYDVCWNQCERAPDQPHRAWPEDRVKPGILRDPGVSVYFCSYEENAHNVSQKNRDIVERGLRKDPIQRQRLIEGKWVSYPSGEALFKDQFSEPIHVRGDAKRNEGLLPMLEYPIIIGYDIGSVNTGISMKQYIPTEDGEVEIVFDELCFYRTRKKVKSVAHVMLEKMRYWTQFLWDSVGYDPDNPPTDEYGEPKPMPVWKFWHIAGDDATTTYNPSKGSTYARDIEQDSRNFIEANPQRYAGIEPIHIRGCPKPPESIKRRVDFTAEALTEGRVFISATCAWHRQMFLHLERADQEGVPKSEHKYGHTFDGYSYPRLYRELKLPEGFKPDDGEPAFEVSTG